MGRKKLPKKPCSKSECSRKAIAKGLCKYHHRLHRQEINPGLKAVYVPAKMPPIPRTVLSDPDLHLVFEIPQHELVKRAGIENDVLFIYLRNLKFDGLIADWCVSRKTKVITVVVSKTSELTFFTDNSQKPIGVL